MTAGIVKKLLKITQYKKKKHNEIIVLAWIKFNTIESIISKTLVDIEISREEFTTTIDEERNYGKLKERIRMMKSQRSGTEKK